MSRLDTVRDRSTKVKKDLAPRAASARGSAAHYADKVAPRVEAAREAVGPHFESARDKVRDDVFPKAVAAAAAALAASEPAREEAKSRGTAALAALKGEVRPADLKRVRTRSRGRRARKMFLLFGLAGVATGAWTWWQRQHRPGWQADEFSGPGVTPLMEEDAPVASSSRGWAPPTSQASGSKDEGGASNDEALSEASDGWRSTR